MVTIGDGESPAVLSVEEAARVLRIGRQAAYAAVRIGTLRSIKIGRRILVPRSAIDELLDGGQATSPAASESQSARGTRGGSA